MRYKVSVVVETEMDPSDLLDFVQLAAEEWGSDDELAEETACVEVA